MFEEHHKKLAKRNKAIHLQDLLEKKERDNAYSESLKARKQRLKQAKEPPLRVSPNGYHCWKTGKPVFVSYDELSEEEIETLVEEGADINRQIDY